MGLQEVKASGNSKEIQIQVIHFVDKVEQFTSFHFWLSPFFEHNIWKKNIVPSLSIYPFMKLDVKLILLFFCKAMCSLVYPTNKMCSYSNLMFHINYYTKYFVNQKYGNILINLSHLNFSDNLLSDSDHYLLYFCRLTFLTSTEPQWKFKPHVT